MKRSVLFLIPVLLLSACGRNVITTQRQEGYTLLHQTQGPTLGYTTAPILEVDGYAFKDLSRDGRLDVYEDWRKPAAERAEDLRWRKSAA